MDGSNGKGTGRGGGYGMEFAVRGVEKSRRILIPDGLMFKT